MNNLRGGAYPLNEEDAVLLVRGSGDIGSAIAHALFNDGYPVLIHDQPTPAVTRRGMAFADAMFDDHAKLAGVEARQAKDIVSLLSSMRGHQSIPVTSVDLSQVLEHIQPVALVDARMRKHNVPEDQRGLARLTIGIGPNFTVGTNVDLAVETAWGEDLGRLVEIGATRKQAGEPRSIGGHGRDRYLYAPTSGIFMTNLKIGDPIEQGQTIANIGANELRAPLSGLLSGLIRNGLTVAAKTKVIEVDPRGTDAPVFGIGERQELIARGVLLAVRRHTVIQRVHGKVTNLNIKETTNETC